MRGWHDEATSVDSSYQRFGSHGLSASHVHFGLEEHDKPLKALLRFHVRAAPDRLMRYGGGACDLKLVTKHNGTSFLDQLLARKEPFRPSITKADLFWIASLEHGLHPEDTGQKDVLGSVEAKRYDFVVARAEEQGASEQGLQHLGQLEQHLRALSRVAMFA